VKQYCAAGLAGCNNVIKRTHKKRGEYCPEHTCKAFSANHGQCILGVNHKMKHAGQDGKEWG
jgi:hypothetical protein